MTEDPITNQSQRMTSDSSEEQGQLGNESSAGSRRRLRSSGGSNRIEQTDMYYQKYFNVEYRGRYFRSTKRKITWAFGVVDQEAAKGGLGGADCRGQEHRVELIWSLKSGKTLVYWNGASISHLFGEQGITDTLKMSWKSDSGDSLELQVHADEVEGKNQYELLVNGQSFHSFPTIGHFEPSERVRESLHSFLDETSNYEGSFGPIAEALSDLGSADYAGPTPADVDFRLSMVGLNHAEEQTEVKDELHSELYSPMLTSLRSQVTEYLPQLEDVVSRAIINAFFVDSESQGSVTPSTASSDSSRKNDAFQVEADMLYLAHEWIEANEGLKESEQYDELRIAHMQEQIDSIFFHVRSDDIAPDQAARVIWSVASYLGLKLTKPLPRDTVVFSKLALSTADEGLYSALVAFGSVVGVGVATKSFGLFGFGRFEDASSVPLLKRAVAKKRFEVHSVTPTMTTLYGGLCEDEEEVSEEESSDNDDDIVDKADSEVGCGSVMPPSTIPHLMAPLGGDYGVTCSFLAMNGDAPSDLKCAPPSERTGSTASASDSDYEISMNICSTHTTASPNSVVSILDPPPVRESPSPTIWSL